MIHLVNERTYQCKYTHNFLKLQDKPPILPYMNFIGNEKFLYVKLVWVIYTAQHIFMSHFILLFWLLKAVICPGCTHPTIIYTVYKACATTILCWIPRHILAQIHCCLFLCLNYSHQKVIMLRIMTVMYFTTSNSIYFL